MYYGLSDFYRLMRALNLMPRVPPWAQPVRKGTLLRYNAPWLRPQPHRNRARDKLQQRGRPKR